MKKLIAAFAAIVVGAFSAIAENVTWTTKTVVPGTTAADGGTYAGVSFDLANDD